MRRKDHPDKVYKTEKEKFDAIAQEIKEYSATGRPVLVGTVSIEKSEKISNMLKNKGVIHNVLNAKYHEREAQIVADAGEPGAVTIATNMAGRGTDIVLGGHKKFIDTMDKYVVITSYSIHYTKLYEEFQVGCWVQKILLNVEPMYIRWIHMAPMYCLL